MIATGVFLARADGRGEPDVPATAPANLRFEVKDGALWVRRGKVRAPLEVDAAHPEMAPDFPLGVRAKRDGAAWTLRVETNCQGDKVLNLSAAALDSRLERAAAGELARRHQWDAAARAFARAVELDPTAAEATTDLAVAQVRGGHTRDAVASLLAAATRHRLWVVWRLAIDRDLAPVAMEPALRALAAQPPGHATLPGLRENGVAVSAGAGLIAWDRVVGSMMDETRPNRWSCASPTRRRAVWWRGCASAMTSRRPWTAAWRRWGSSWRQWAESRSTSPREVPPTELGPRRSTTCA